jgi:O-acetyl-ADP-ribose deacetylase (regulator of RNase III)
VEHGCKSIAFPSISTGAYGYPVESASRVALAAIRDLVNANPESLDLIEIATFSARDHQTYLRAYCEIFADPAPA